MDKSMVDLSKLPKAKGWSKRESTLYQGCWFPSFILPSVLEIQQQFQAEEQDIFLASIPKSGTTWLKALLFSIVNRNRYASSESPLLTQNPHTLVPFLEVLAHNHSLPTQDSPSPRLFASHIPYASLPESIASKCRIIYICRNPLDIIVSFWNFCQRGFPNNYGPRCTLEECIEKFCKGQSGFGPFWDHVLGFWKASLEAPEKVLFLKYEDMLEDTASQVKRIAEFVGIPFTEEEDNSGVVEQILQFCSLRNLKELDVNKNSEDVLYPNLEYKIYFRKGQVGDWVNYLSPSMVENVKKIVEKKLYGSGVTFKYSL